MEELEINIGNFRGTLNRSPKNLEETGHVIKQALEKLIWSIENDKKDEIKIYLVKKYKFEVNGKRD